jgi:sugar lactone lactonase YvrE
MKPHHDATPHVGPPLQEVARFRTPVTGVAVSPEGRVFVSLPRMIYRPRHAVVEILPSGEQRPYPDETWNRWDGAKATAPDAFVCAQSVHIDDSGRTLWVLDPAKGGPLSNVVPGGPKLVAVDLASDRVVRTIRFDDKAAPRKSYLNDVRVDSSRQVAYITESGIGALLVSDLTNGQTRRLLEGHVSTKAEPDYVPVIGGKRWTIFLGIRIRGHVDGLALDRRGGWVYYHPLTGGTLYRVPVRALDDAAVDEATLTAAVERLAHTGGADGMRMDDAGRLYITAIEQDAVLRYQPDGAPQTVVQDSRLRWPDSMDIHEVQGRRRLFVTSSRIHETWPFNWGRSLAEAYYLFCVDLTD